MNSAFVFIKPHAVTNFVKALVQEHLESKGIRIICEGSLSAEMIDEKKLIDQHYYAIASKATILKPAELNVPKDKFKNKFNLEWDEALANCKVFNAMDACSELGLNSDELAAAWDEAKKTDKLVKFGGGFYCGYVEVDGKDPIYVFNGFFMSMRAKFTKPKTSIYYYVVEWDPSCLCWAHFRGNVLGPTDPAVAPKDSLRGKIFARWPELGLADVPSIGDNGVHASASPFEAFAERINWLEASPTSDAFYTQLLEAGIPEKTIRAWCVDPQVVIAHGKQSSIFDQLEDLDTSDCVCKMQEIAQLQPPEI